MEEAPPLVSVPKPRPDVELCDQAKGGKAHENAESEYCPNILQQSERGERDPGAVQQARRQDALIDMALITVRTRPCLWGIASPTHDH